MTILALNLTLKIHLRLICSFTVVMVLEVPQQLLASKHRI